MIHMRLGNSANLMKTKNTYCLKKRGCDNTASSLCPDISTNSRLRAKISIFKIRDKNIDCYEKEKEKCAKRATSSIYILLN